MVLGNYGLFLNKLCHRLQWLTYCFIKIAASEAYIIRLPCKSYAEFLVKAPHKRLYIEGDATPVHHVNSLQCVQLCLKTTWCKVRLLSIICVLYNINHQSIYQ